jgi:hypothetical protein
MRVSLEVSSRTYRRCGLWISRPYGKIFYECWRRRRAGGTFYDESGSGAAAIVGKVTKEMRASHDLIAVADLLKGLRA